MVNRAADINKLLGLGAEHALSYKQGNWYHLLKRFPAILIDPGGYIRFSTEDIYRSYPGVRIGPKHIHVTGGIDTLRDYQPFSAAQLALLQSQEGDLLYQEEALKDERTLRQKRQIESVIRSKKLVQEIKKLYNHTCQLCGLQLQVGPDEFYSEVHHIKPLGRPHNGPDNKANMLCVCPNHHTLLDFFAIKLNPDELLVKKHRIDNDFFLYHNQITDL